MMERLSDEYNYLKSCINCKNDDCFFCIPLTNALDKLAEYEDLEEQGLLLRLPCKVGDTVYRISKVGKKRDIRERVVKSMTYHLDNQGEIVWEIYSSKEDILGNTVFLTRKEAKAKLKELEGK